MSHVNSQESTTYPDLGIPHQSSGIPIAPQSSFYNIQVLYAGANSSYAPQHQLSMDQLLYRAAPPSSQYIMTQTYPSPFSDGLISRQSSIELPHGTYNNWSTQHEQNWSMQPSTNPSSPSSKTSSTSQNNSPVSSLEIYECDGLTPPKSRSPIGAAFAKRETERPGPALFPVIQQDARYQHGQHFMSYPHDTLFGSWENVVPTGRALATAYHRQQIPFNQQSMPECTETCNDGTPIEKRCYEGPPVCPRWPDNFFKNQMFLNFEQLSSYKTEKCNNRAYHNWNECPHVHAKRKTSKKMIQEPCRRNPAIHFYKPVYCPNMNNHNAMGTCPDGDSCQMCHTLDEYNFHPLVYKQTKCRKFTSDDCTKVSFCPFDHGDNPFFVGRSPRVIKIIKAMCLDGDLDHSNCTKGDKLHLRSIIEAKPPHVKRDVDQLSDHIHVFLRSWLKKWYETANIDTLVTFEDFVISRSGIF